MGILKKGSYSETPVSNFIYSNVDLNKDNTENLKFDKEEYLAVMEEARETGYKEGLENGYNEGYKNGVEKFEEEKQELYVLLDSDKANLKSFLENESFKYISNFQKNIQSLVLESINKIFLNTLANEDILKSYIENLVVYLNESFDEYSISVNEKTLAIVLNVIDKNKGSFKVDNSLEDYNVLVFSNNEYKEYFLQDEFDKIKELFV